MDGASGFVETVVDVVCVEADPIVDELIDTLNVVLAEGQWDLVVVLALTLREHALAVGDEQLAALVEDLRVIALDAVAHPSGDDGSFGVVLVGGDKRREGMDGYGFGL